MNRAGRKYYRTVLLGIAALAALVWAAVDQFGISWEEMLDLFLVTLAAIGIVILAAALFALIWIGVRNLFGGD